SKYAAADGKLLAPVSPVPEREPTLNGGGEPAAPEHHVPGQGTMGPVAGFLPPPGGRKPLDPEVKAKREAAIAAFRMKYPPTTPMIVGQVEEVRLDEPAHEMYVAD